MQYSNGTAKHVQSNDVVTSDSVISIRELQCSGKLSFSFSLINDSKEEYTKDYHLNIKETDKLQVILQEVVNMFIKSFMNSAAGIKQKVDKAKAKEMSKAMMDIIIKDLSLQENETVRDKGIEIGCQDGLLDF